MKKLPRKPLISLCMIVKNEAETLAGCLNSVRGVADEIIVVDTGSTDATPQIAREYGARLVKFPWNGDFAAARNAGLERARGAWILVLDADEELEADSREELLICAQHTEYEAFFLRIHNHRGLSRLSPTITVNPILRMFRNRPEYRFTGIIHEQIASVIVGTRPEAAMHLTSAVIHHYGYADGVVARKDKISRNLRLLEEQLKQEPGDGFHHYNMAVEYMRLGEYDPALHHIAESLKLSEAGTSYVHLLYKYKVRCHLALGGLPSALSVCREGLTLFPDYTDLHHLLGVLLMQGGAFAAAGRSLREALRIGASPPAYHTEAGYGSYLTLAALGQLSQETGEISDAVACYIQAARLHPEPWPLLARLVRTLKCAGREHEIPGWLARHLPEMWAAERPRILELLLRDGCFAAAASVCRAELDGGDGSVSSGNIDTADGGEDQRGTAGADNSCTDSSGKPDAVIVRLASLLQDCLDKAEPLTREDILALLDGAAPDRPPDRPSIRQSRAWLLLADRALAGVPAASAYAAAAARARLILPLPGSGE
ncbi:tetratricopeptide repeat-containing glycosyltransferase family 2 protein [Paenibacillus tengchongensis]|uniref:tetratricopeptide repeat-containing glycosyltransferase family 2 protein n=1 Tax=Paenibacillus tengchongensis TaxID=2608684 RepID=UPI00124C92C4|nr:glycosyltransferase family 2 protein [Paenibacillus tengchongensis]